MEDSKLKLLEIPEYIGRVEICDKNFLLINKRYPNWWFRFWQKILLGFKWTRI